ncbi:MAG: WYL domain-containing protein [Holdemanella sp.]|nr:WYL domain-containing protein [Holdemanella sp.]
MDKRKVGGFMNRTALCIKMLNLLKSRGKMNTDELAEALDTNKRNIREFRKELEVAGFPIRETKGRYGGYELDTDELLVTPKLTTEETMALEEARALIAHHKEFDKFIEYNTAIDKVIALSRDRDRSSKVYMDAPGKQMSVKEKDMMDAIQKGVDLSQCINLTYQGQKDKKPNTFLFDPYEIIHYRQAYYAIGFSQRRNAIRVFRISEERMSEATLCDRKFLKDSDYLLEKYVGKSNLIKGNFETVYIKVKEEKRRMFKEAYWGMGFEEVETTDAYSIFKFTTEDIQEMYRNLFSFVDACEILQPKTIRNAYKKQVRTTYKAYKEKL